MVEASRVATAAPRYAVVGVDSPDNFQLAEILRRIRGKDAVARFLDLAHVEPFIESHSDGPMVVLLDLFGFDLLAATNFIGRVRENHPTVVFSLYIDKAEFQARRGELPAQWRDRLGHYYRLYKENDPEIEFEPTVRAALQLGDWEAGHNMEHGPIHLTPVFKRGLSGTGSSNNQRVDGNIAFVSYARHDWDGFVSSLVSDLGKEPHKVWIDQEYLAGGDDWMDAIGQALRICDTMLLILSPESISSKYVKMEYRYFFKYDKPIIPILYKQIDSMPFELATLNYIDFTRADQSRSYQELIRVLSRRGRGNPA
jgi:TIR domain-containing protein